MRHPAYRYGSLAYRYGPTAFKYGSRAVRWAYKRYKKGKSKQGPAKRARRSIGENIGSSSAKNRIIVNDNAFEPRATRTLYFNNLTLIPHEAGERNQRERNIVNVRGFKLCMAMHNFAIKPLYVNVAVLSPKNQGGITPENFFRSNEQERGTDFVDGLPALSFHCLNINTDKFYILKHKRYVLNPRRSANGNENNVFNNGDRKNYKNIQWYVKLKRQIRYDRTDTDSPIDGACYLVYWCDLYDNPGNSVATSDQLRVMQRHVTYFRESKQCC